MLHVTKDICGSQLLTRYLFAQDCGFLVNMAVAQEQRRQGYGAMLLKTAESFAALANKEAIYLHVRSGDVET